MQWLTSVVWIVWLALAAVLAVAEMATLDFTLLMLAGGALAGFLVALGFPELLWLQVVAFVVAAALLLWMLRPTLLRRVRAMPGYRSTFAKLVGSNGHALADVTSTSGEAKLGGEIWTARSADGSTIPEGAEVEVFKIDGATAIVFPKNSPIPGDGAWARPEST